MGNSEVGHMNLGSGRIVYQDFAKINLDIDQNKFKELENLKNPLKEVKKNKKKLHLIGLVSDGGVHSHIKHLEAILKLTDCNISRDQYNFKLRWQFLGICKPKHFCESL